MERKTKKREEKGKEKESFEFRLMTNSPVYENEATRVVLGHSHKRHERGKRDVH